MLAVLLLCVVSVACGPNVPPDLQPDAVLRAELGLTDEDEVHSVRISGAERELVVPREVFLSRAAWVQFVSGDWRVHEVRFEVDSLTADAADFLGSTDQIASPPLIERDARFVVSFHEAPAGRYPFTVEGNTRSVSGVVVVQPRR